MTPRTLTVGPTTSITEDIRNHGYAILQTHIERVPPRYRDRWCGHPDGCHRPATLTTFAVAEITDEGNDTTGYRYARDNHGRIMHAPTCEEHRCDASHVLYYLLTGRLRPDGIRAFDVVGQHINWT